MAGRRRRRGELEDGIDIPADVVDEDAGGTIGARARELDVPVDAEGEDEIRVSEALGWRRFVHSGAIPVGHGIKARTRRGAIGSSWWSRRFVSVIESLELGGRLDRARTYARKGQVVDLDVSPGRISARVQGSSATPYKVTIEMRTLSHEGWERAIEELSRRAAFAARLLAGEMPEDVESAFTDTRVPLFPESADDLAMSCSCPDWAVPCKHVAAVLYLLAEQLDDDPFLLMLWRGMSEDELLGRLRALRRPAGDGGDAGTGGPVVESRGLDERIGDFWEGSEVRLVARAPDTPPDPLGFADATEPRAGPLRQLLGSPRYRAVIRSASQAARRAATDPA